MPISITSLVLMRKSRAHCELKRRSPLEDRGYNSTKKLLSKAPSSFYTQSENCSSLLLVIWRTCLTLNRLRRWQQIVHVTCNRQSIYTWLKTAFLNSRMKSRKKWEEFSTVGSLKSISNSSCFRRHSTSLSIWLTDSLRNVQLLEKSTNSLASQPWWSLASMKSVTPRISRTLFTSQTTLTIGNRWFSWSLKFWPFLSLNWHSQLAIDLSSDLQKLQTLMSKFSIWLATCKSWQSLSRIWRNGLRQKSLHPVFTLPRRCSIGRTRGVTQWLLIVATQWNR